jgi:UDP-glucose 6-dehydrogenase
MFDLCHRLGIDFGGVRDIAGADARIGMSHMDVHDGGYRGYGGKCLPKDTKALLDLARTMGAPMDVLAGADRANMRLRGPDELPGADDLLARLRPLAPAAERAA